MFAQTNSRQATAWRGAAEPVILGRPGSMNRIATLLVPMILLSACTLQAAAESNLKVVSAPALRDYATYETTDLGVWDAAFACDELDCFVLRQGEELFSLPMDAAAKPVKIAAIRQGTKVEIVAAIQSKTRLWLFCQSPEIAPFALELNSGKRIDLAIPDLRIPGEQAPSIQSHIMVPHADAAILMIAGGDRKTWPREGNRPVYFWIGLQSGTVVRFPIGWDLEYFSSDQTVAVFEKPQEERFQRRPLQAVDVRTGDTRAEIPNRREGAVIPFDWEDTQRVKPLYVRRPETGDADHFAGASLNGRTYRFDTQLSGVYYLSTAKEKEGFIGFRLRREGSVDSEPSNFWFGPLRENQNPTQVASAVTDFEMFHEETCVLVTTGHGPKKISLEAFVYDHKSKTAWNVLDGIERLPPLGTEFTGRDYIEDKMTVRLVPGHGSGQQGQLVLCLASQVREDRRALAFPPQEKRLKTERWSRAILVSANGWRMVTDILANGMMPDAIWLHNSGKIIIGEHKWTAGEARPKIQLRRIDLKLKAQGLDGN